MSNNGRYVRAPKYFDPQPSNDENDPEQPEENIAPGHVYDSDEDNTDNQSDASETASYSAILPAKPTAVPGTSNNEKSNLSGESNDSNVPLNNDRLQRLENMLFDLTKAVNSMQSTRPTSCAPDTDQIWCTSVTNTTDNSMPSIRWDNIKPFPTGVPANKMWEEWNRYIENFEIAASLSNANDPVRRMQLLFLSIGDELQNIVRAAKLIPSLNDAGCYRNFVDNIRNHFKSMTDAAAEHEAFSNMRQDKSESAIAFHARLTAKVRLCGYSPSDQDRFVRAQLLKGLKNQELVKTARTYGHDTNYIVQAATRYEAYESETAGPSSSNGSNGSESYAINRVQRQPYFHSAGREPYGKRPRPASVVDKSQPKYFRGNQHAPANRRELQERGRRTRCRRCNGFPHSNFPCPALNRNCNLCGERGHYGAVCRRSRIRELQFKSDDSTPDNHEDHDQVLKN